MSDMLANLLKSVLGSLISSIAGFFRHNKAEEHRTAAEAAKHQLQAERKAVEDERVIRQAARLPVQALEEKLRDL